MFLLYLFFSQPFPKKFVGIELNIQISNKYLIAEHFSTAVSSSEGKQKLAKSTSLMTESQNTVNG